MYQVILQTKVITLFAVLLVLPFWVQAHEYTCTIKNTSQINKNGFFVKHAWAANYMNRNFSVDANTGVVLRTTALKQRLSNSDADNKPVILSQGKTDVPLKVFTHYPEAGKYALLQIYNHAEFSEAENKPFFYHTNIGMILSGTCSDGLSQE